MAALNHEWRIGLWRRGGISLEHPPLDVAFARVSFHKEFALNLLNMLALLRPVCP